MANPDERVREDVGDVLARLPGIDVGNIELQVAEGVVRLTGTVENPQAWHDAQTAIAKVPGVRRVDNQLRLSEGRLNEALNDLSATGTGTTRRTER
jgi:osmotically-inducible protein OsmY